MLRMRIKLSRLAALLALISFFLVKVPHADACKDSAIICNQLKPACCEDICSDDSKDSKESDTSPIANHCPNCCSINEVMVQNAASFDEALLLLGALAPPQKFVFPSFVTTIERPPEVV